MPRNARSGSCATVLLRSHVEIGTIQGIQDPGATTTEALAAHMMRYNLAEPPSDCCVRFVKHGGSAMPLLEWLTTVYFSVAIHDHSAMRSELSSLLPSSLAGFCRGISGDDGRAGGVKSVVRVGTQPASAVKGFMRHVGRMIDVCSGSTTAGVDDVWRSSVEGVSNYVCTVA